MPGLCTILSPSSESRSEVADLHFPYTNLDFGFLDDLERLSEKLFELGARVEEEEEKYAYSDDELTSSALELRRYLKKRTKLRIAARKVCWFPSFFDASR